jgi:hypothetical protein
MRKISPIPVATAGAALLILAGTVAFATPQQAAVPANPTQQQALDGLEAARLYIQQHPDVAPTTVPPTTTTAPPTTTAASTVPANFTATAGDQKIVLKWAKPLGGTPTGYIYGRNGVDNTGYGPYTSPVQPATTLTMTLDKLINGSTYAVFVEAVYPTGNQRVTLNATPVVPAPTTTTQPPVTTTTAPPATTTAVPTTTTTGPASDRPSGLPWSSGVWASGNATQNQRFVTNVRGGLPLDNILVYTYRNSMAAQNNPSSWWAILPTNFNQATQDLVLGLTTWTSDGAFMTAAQAQGIGTSLCGLDSTPIVRLDWEMNLADGAGDNGAALTASNYTAWVARFRAVATGLKATCPATRIDFNPNHGADQTSGCNSGTYAAPNNCSRRAFQALKDVVDIFGIDRYDAWPPVTASGSGWSAHLTPFNELDESRTYALANGKKWSLPEWGVWITGGHGGGDDPEYIKRYIAYLAAHANDVAYETYFNYPDTWIISDLIDNNPNSRAQYRASVLAQ